MLETTWKDFSGGRVTNRNLTGISTQESLIATDVVFLGDEAVAKRPGYTLKLNLGQDGKVFSLFDFQRDSDASQFLLAQQQQVSLGACSLYSINAASLIKTLLSNTEDPFAEFAYVPLDYAAYMSNGLKSYRMVDQAGTNKIFKWGIAAPAVAPAIALPAGVLTLTYGRQYVACAVSKITDLGGTTRIHVGKPSPITGSTGPITSKTPTLTLATETDTQVTHIWIFSTFDNPADSSSVYLFNGEVTNGTASYGDTVTDANLDITRLAPFDNNPAPAGEIVLQFASRTVVAKIPGNPTLVQLSGFEEIALGIPQEAFPSSLQFKIPGGKQALSAGAVFNQSLFLSTQDFLWQIQGFDVETFTKKDKVAQPGAVGKKAMVVTPQYLVWLGKDKKLWAWDGVNTPINASDQLGKPLPGSLSMEDLSDSELPNLELRYYTFGRYNLLVLLANSGTAPSGYFDWIQLWDASFIGKTLDSGQVQMLGEADMFPSDIMATSALVDDNNKTYIFFGDIHGNIFRWPDGYQDNGQNYAPVWGSGWSELQAPEVTKALHYADLYTDRMDAPNQFKVSAVSGKVPNMIKKAIACQVRALPDDADPDPMAARAYLDEPGAASGLWSRFVVQFPVDDQPATLHRFSVQAEPLDVT
jgi:hypothetical protein